MEFKPHDVVWTPENTSRYWGYINSNTSLSQNYFTKTVGRSVVSHLVGQVPLEGKSILDFGCGPGYIFKFLQKTSSKFDYYGLDFSSDSVERLKNSLAKEPNFKDAYFVSGYPTGISQKFDVIVCCEVLEHLDDQILKGITEEFKRLLKKDGYLYITVPNDEDLNASKFMCPDCGCMFHKWQHQRNWNKSNITKHFESNGFNTLGVFEKNFYPSPSRTFLAEKAKGALKMKMNNLIWVGQIK